MCSDSGSHCRIHKRWLVLQGLGSLQLPGCAQGGFQAFPGCTIGGPHTELHVKERKGKWEALRLAVRAPPRRSAGVQTLFRTPKAVKAFVFSKDYDLLVTGGGDWAVPDLPGQGLWCASTEMGAELWCPGCQCRERLTAVFAVHELRTVALLHCFRRGQTPQGTAQQLIPLNMAFLLVIQTPE